MPHKGPSSSPTEGAVGQELQPAAEPATGLQQPLASRNPPYPGLAVLCTEGTTPHYSDPRYFILICTVLF